MPCGDMSGLQAHTWLGLHRAYLVQACKRRACGVGLDLTGDEQLGGAGGDRLRRGNELVVRAAALAVGMCVGYGEGWLMYSPCPR